MARTTLDDPAMRDPARRYDTPEQILEDRNLSSEQKRVLLERWRQLSGTPVTAEGESGDTNLAVRLARALAFLDSETGSRPATHDQGFYTAVSDIGAEDNDREEKR